jgi:hypothetical protein
MPVALVENRPVAEALQPADGAGRFLVQLITPGWGSSGYYPQDVLESAARDRVWPAGTHMYLDHPTESETYERPERSVRDLAAVTVENARWDPTRGALVAEARVFSPWRQPLAEMLDVIGVSIRGAAEGEMGEAEGRRGRVFTRLVEGTSVDFVTHAGRGGKVLQVLESARGRTTAHEARNVGQWVESRIHRDFTTTADEMFGDGRLTREERITLSGAIGDALAAFVARLEADAPDLYQRDLWDEPPLAAAQAVERAVHRGVAEATANDRREQLADLVKAAHSADGVWVWVRDFDDQTVWFDVESGDDAGTWQQTYDVTDDVATALTGERTEVRAQTTYVPVTATAADEATSVPSRPAGQPTATEESKEDTMALTQIEESRLAQLEKDAGRATALESERDTAQRERDEAREALAARDARDKLRPVAAKVLAESQTLPPVIRARVTDQVVEGIGSDATEDTVKAAAEAARTAAETEAAAIAEMYGVGQVRGLGGTTTPEKTTVDESAYDARSASVFGRTPKEA